MLSQRSSARVARLSVAFFVLALLGGLLLPIYSDEIGWRLQERAGIDGVDKMYDALCGSGTALAPPFWMMPVRWYSAFFNTRFADPFYVRLSGVGYALVWAGLFALVIRAAVGASKQGRLLGPVIGLAAGLASMGTLPLLLVLSRPEQPLGLAVVIAVLVASADWNRSSDAADETATSWRRSLAIAAAGAIALSYHLKGLFILPVLMACLLTASRGRASRLPKAVAAALLVVVAISAARYWLARLACPSDAHIAALVAGENMSGQLMAVRTPAELLTVVTEMARHLNIFAYVGVTAPKPDPMAFWLPAGRVGAGASQLWSMLLALAWIPALLLAALGLVERGSDAVAARRLDGRVLIMLSLLASIAGWIALQRLVNVYEGMFVLPMLLLVVIIGATSLRTATVTTFLPAANIAGTLVAVAGIASILATACLYAPPLLQAREDRGYLRDQPLSVSLFGYSRVRDAVLAAGKACGIGEPERLNRLLIDDVTYFAYMRSRLPDHVGVASAVRPGPHHIPYMARMQSDGIILSCRRLPADVRDRAVRTGDFCCVAPPERGPVSSRAQ